MIPIGTARPQGAFADWLEQLRGNQQQYLLDHSVTPFIMRTYSDLVRDIEAAAEQWMQAGIGPGHAVILSLPSGLQLLTQLFAVLRTGATPLPLTPQIAPESLDHLIELANPAAVVVASPRPDSLLEREGIVHPHKAFGLKGRARLYIRPAAPCREQLHHCLMLSTSGSTGMPKIVVHRVENVFVNAAAHMKAIEEQPGGNYTATLPVFYSYGLVAGIIGSLLMEKNIYFPEQPFYPGEWLKSCEHNDITLASVTPSLLKRIVAMNKPFPRTLRKLTIGGDHADDGDIRKLRELYSGDIYLTYGLSEAGPRVLTNKLSRDERGWSLMGEPLSGVEIRVDGKCQEQGGQVGELLVKTATRMLGYWEDGRFQQGDFEGEWLRTGDIVSLDNGGLQFMERRKNMLITGGEKLYPGIIRKVLLAHPGVVEAKVSGVVDEKQGFVPEAVIQLQEETAATIEELESWCKKRLRLAEVPRSFRIVPYLESTKK
ncbi:AMP-dependent synthetase and ligase [Paenibacillus curdlanolyticus YK9]|uniref:AMP-dependent synthetase and ligase n=1 Tax=Paenibacillus curdlanolyticus YK9 TaxID=717606 RepID=E0I8M0_9BACL|nr:class I adenylate-forming enzyme family protein [Paenibacillus curdlanolyticus]EFM11525.1 AMP-dependent synthetase and ligase [Paenibacillus curdlanolyticus YK9]